MRTAVNRSSQAFKTPPSEPIRLLRFRGAERWIRVISLPLPKPPSLLYAYFASQFSAAFVPAALLRFRFDSGGTEWLVALLASPNHFGAPSSRFSLQTNPPNIYHLILVFPYTPLWKRPALQTSRTQVFPLICEPVLCAFSENASEQLPPILLNSLAFMSAG